MGGCNCGPFLGNTNLGISEIDRLRCSDVISMSLQPTGGPLVELDANEICRLISGKGLQKTIVGGSPVQLIVEMKCGPKVHHIKLLGFPAPN